jgi:hypothetical protein
MSTLLRKITIKNLGFGITDIKEAVKETGQASLAKIVGVTQTATPGQTDKGSFLKFGGSFKAVNNVTGEIFESSTCILPNFVAESMAAALENTSELEFGLEIGARAVENSVTGYEFVVLPLVETKPSDKMQELLKIAGIGENTPAIEAPKKGAKK